MKYVVIERASKRFVEAFVFDETGVHITFTSEPDKAARVSLKEVADHIAKCVPGGQVRSRPEAKKAKK
jgi:hypothetical protein